LVMLLPHFSLKLSNYNLWSEFKIGSYITLKVTVLIPSAS
jgi:hypothetical protein